MSRNSRKMSELPSFRAGWCKHNPVQGLYTPVQFKFTSDFRRLFFFSVSLAPLKGSLINGLDTAGGSTVLMVRVVWQNLNDPPAVTLPSVLNSLQLKPPHPQHFNWTIPPVFSATAIEIFYLVPQRIHITHYLIPWRDTPSSISSLFVSTNYCCLFLLAYFIVKKKRLLFFFLFVMI